jgi:hypothetical protein
MQKKRILVLIGSVFLPVHSPAGNMLNTGNYDKPCLKEYENKGGYFFLFRAD